MKNTEEKIQVLNELRDYAYSFLKPEAPFIDKVQMTFDITLPVTTQVCDYNDPKGLHGFNNESSITGVDCFIIPDVIARKLNVKLVSDYFGRGRQFQSEISEIIEYLKKDEKGGS